MNARSTTEHGDRPLITFALLAYNQERYIREAVEGALAQTYSPLQIILSDDCSSDRTFDILQEMAAAYHGPHQITVNRNPHNLGMGEHLNRVFELAPSEVVVLAAGDDISLPHRVAVVADAFADDVMAVFSSVTFIDEHGVVLRDERVRPDLRNEQSYAYRARMYCRGVFHGSSSAYRKKLFEVFGPLLTSTTAEDKALTFRAYALGQVRYVDQPLVKYRTHDQNVWTTVRLVSKEGLRQMAAKRARIMRTTYLQFLADLNRTPVGHADLRDFEEARRIIIQRANEEEAKELVLSQRWMDRLAGLWRCITKPMRLFARGKVLLTGTVRWAYLYRLQRIGNRLAASTNAH